MYLLNTECETCGKDIKDSKCYEINKVFIDNDYSLLSHTPLYLICKNCFNELTNNSDNIKQLINKNMKG